MFRASELQFYVWNVRKIHMWLAITKTVITQLNLSTLKIVFI